MTPTADAAPAGRSATGPSGGGGGPLAGVRIVELGGIGPGPFAGMILADLGADVVRVDRPAEHGSPSRHPILHRGRRSVTADLKDPRGVGLVGKLIDGADALIEGFRPGVTERLGLGPGPCLERNPRLVYGRMTGWGQDGPLAQAPGHDINYIAVAGALAQIGPADGDPVVPLNLFGDMGGGGLLLALGISAALYSARTTGRGQVVDAAMTDGTAIQLALLQGLLRTGQWTEGRGSNLFDGAAPFYRTYRCADGLHMAVGCVEPQFYAETLRVLGLTGDPLFARQHDRGAWPAMAAKLAEVFAGRTRDDWTARFDGTETCVTPVLDWTEAARHPHNAGRGTYRITPDGYPEPGTAPRFLGTPSPEPRPAAVTGSDTDEVLRQAGIGADELAALRSEGVIG
ncbi:MULTISPECIES: CaiB/BaiF CoA transferase family protein [Streptomyces]|uniref:CoA transferase n=1 Tax=Streptomyces tsukubensis (strain DSM 42081 / NBRC 108919 / NRRL 18488 / 9993) TaxID=1114943 RepID=I2N7Q7_STRT9|nr:CaiB/BaiF CoA-transferase family protein [Streptomyces tsukubensis]MYS66435.1 CoA transferase [Streptomyces sp. SID5473]AZK96970.1 CoA transferase [Streptomyces tsukubensis]EIF93054.1 fatty acid-CoA racemase [Streptomyces tsukubensis NRRL18488]QKM67049.1 CoA transferase [Streptomyces tsukubensis NRRL18488]TAI41470.1 CoA transferase [Streptomyces tsukubensis]